MHDKDFEKLEKKLKNIDLPDFELSQRKKILRQALLNSAYFEKNRGWLVNFKFVMAPSLAVACIVLVAIFGYPYLNYFYRGAQAKSLVDKLDTAMTNLGSKKGVYALMHEDSKGINLPLKKIQDIPASQAEILKDNSLINEAKNSTDPSLNIKKIELDTEALKNARFLQYIGEEKANGVTLKKIRYTNQEGNLVTEIKIDSRTSLPVEIKGWKPKENIKKQRDLTNPSIFTEQEENSLEHSTRSVEMVKTVIMSELEQEDAEPSSEPKPIEIRGRNGEIKKDIQEILKPFPSPAPDSTESGGEEKTDEKGD